MEDVKELIWFDPKDIMPKEYTPVLVALADFAYRGLAPYFESPYWVGKYVSGDMCSFNWFDDFGQAYSTEDIVRWAYIPKPFRRI